VYAREKFKLLKNAVSVMRSRAGHLNTDVSKERIAFDLQIPTVKEEIRRYSSQYQTTADCEGTCQIIGLPDS
jgi:hypothetical protein